MRSQEYTDKPLTVSDGELQNTGTGEDFSWRVARTKYMARTL